MEITCHIIERTTHTDATFVPPRRIHFSQDPLPFAKIVVALIFFYVLPEPSYKSLTPLTSDGPFSCSGARPTLDTDLAEVTAGGTAMLCFLLLLLHTGNLGKRSFDLWK